MKWIHFILKTCQKLPVFCTKVDHVNSHVNWYVNWLLRRSIFVTFFSFSSWPLFSVAEKEKTTGVLYVIDSSCPERIGSSTVSKVSYFNSFLIHTNQISWTFLACTITYNNMIISFHFQGAFSGTSQVQCCILSTIK